MVVEAVIFDVSSFVEVEDGPIIVRVVDTISFRVDVASFKAGVIVENDLDQSEQEI